METMQVLLLSAPKNPPRHGPASAVYEYGRGNILGDALLDRGHVPIIWWDHPEGDLLACQPDLVLLRSAKYPNLERAHALEQEGFRVINTPGAHRFASDKWEQAQRFKDHGVAHPTSSLGDLTPWSSNETLVIKPRIGDSGNGVRLARCCEVPAVIGPNEMIQSKVAVTEDFRAVVVGETIVNWSRRAPRPGEFRSNLALGARWDSADSPSGRADAEVLAACRVLGLEIAGVDLVMSPEGPMVLEVNAGTTLHGPTAHCTTTILAAVLQLIETCGGTS